MPNNSYPNEYMSETLNSTGTPLAVSFGFAAGLVRVKALAGGDVKVRFKSTSAADLASTALGLTLTTADAALELRNIGAGISGLSICATSTASLVGVWAWG